MEDRDSSSQPDNHDSEIQEEVDSTTTPVNLPRTPSLTRSLSAAEVLAQVPHISPSQWANLITLHQALLRSQMNTNSSTRNGAEESIESGTNNSSNIGLQARVRLQQNSERRDAQQTEENQNSQQTSDEDSQTRTLETPTLDLQIALKWLEANLAFLLLLLLLFCYNHRLGISLFIWLSFILYHANQNLKKQVSLKENREILPLFLWGSFLAFHVFLVYVAFAREKLWQNLLFFPPTERLSVWDLLWKVVLNDLMVRYVTMTLKCILVIVTGHRPPHKRRQQMYSVVELLSSFYRNMLPVPLWFAYFLQEDLNTSKIFVSSLAGLYLAVKFTGALQRLRQVIVFVKAFVLQELQYGKYATAEEVLESGEACPICQDKMTSPIVLPCSHIFCEECVSEWFEREKTCPICRAVVKSAGNRTHSDGTTSMVATIF